MSRRQCLLYGKHCSDGGFAVPGRSRCRAHGGRAWAGQPPERQQHYYGDWPRLRRIVLEREKTCRWRLPGCLVVATECDHIVPVSVGGSNSLDNLAAACSHCNRLRGAQAGAAATARRRRRST